MNSKKTTTLLEIKNLNVSYKSKSTSYSVLKGIDFVVQKGEILAIVGETGSGKTTMGRALLNINPKNAISTFEGIRFVSENELSISSLNQLNDLRGSEISMLFQESTLFLNPTMKCGNQMMEAIMLDEIIDKKIAKEKILTSLESIGFSDPDRIFRSFPNQLSGGECQRVMLVMATIRNPSLLIADEPTSSIDTATKEKIFEYFEMLVESCGMSIVFITHDLPLALDHSDKIYVMKEGEIIDTLITKNFASSGKSDYTTKLFLSNDRLGNLPIPDLEYQETETFLSVGDLNIFHASSGGRSLFFNNKKHAVKQASFTINKGETLGILGESGSGKTSLAWCLSGLIGYQSGSIEFSAAMSNSDIQMVFQNPGLALSPKQKVGKAVEEVILSNKKKFNGNFHDKLTEEYFEMVGLNSNLMSRLPHQLSGGEKQRVCIAKALAAQPKLIIFDEAVSSLDSSVKTEILELLVSLRDKSNLTYIFISHDQSVIRFVADHIMIMEEGVLSDAESAIYRS